MGNTLDQLKIVMESRWLWGAYLTFALLIPIAYTVWFRWSLSKGPENRLPDQLRDLATMFRGRAFRLRLWSGVFLYATILVLFSGLYFVVFVAKELVESDSPYLVDLNNRIEAANEKRKILDAEAKSLRANVATALAQGGGETWFAPPHALSSSRIYKVRFLDAKTGWLVGDRRTDAGIWKPLLASTGDGGDTWTEASLPADLDRGTLFDIYITAALDPEARTLWAAGREGRHLGDPEPLVLVSSDGGTTWARQGLPEKLKRGRLNTIKFLDEKRGWAVGTLQVENNPIGSPVILNTNDGGQLWTVQTLPDGIEKGTLEDIEVFNPQLSWAVGSVWPRDRDDKTKKGRGLVLSTSDGGKSGWIREQVPDLEEHYYLNGVHFINADTGIAVGSEYLGSSYRMVVLATSDGGASWTRRIQGSDAELPVNDGDLSKVHFVDPQKGWAVGNGPGQTPLILTTDDGGESWRHQTMPEPGPTGKLTSLTFLKDGQTGWTVGFDGEKPLLLATRTFAHDVADQSPADLLLFLKSEAPPHIEEKFSQEAAALEADIKATDTRIEELIEFTSKIITPEPGAIQYGPLLTRITALVLIFLLVNLLVRLYQYNTRLAAFYDARGDALILSDGQGSMVRDMSLNDMIQGLSPDGHDYAVMPKSPMEQVTEVAKTVATRGS